MMFTLPEFEDVNLSGGSAPDHVWRNAGLNH
jgi:hypothetical protein